MQMLDLKRFKFFIFYWYLGKNSRNVECDKDWKKTTKESNFSSFLDQLTSSYLCQVNQSLQVSHKTTRTSVF